MGTHYDSIVIGAGILGLAVARELAARYPESRIAVVEKESVVAAHQTGHNSGVVHGGIYYEPGSLKARLCVEGARLTYEYCEANEIAFERCGKLIVAIRDDELGRLDALEERGRANSVPGLRRVRAEEIPEIEPNARGIAALHAPNTGIVDYTAVCRAIHAELVGQGVDFYFDVEVDSIDPHSVGAKVKHSGGAFIAARVISCAGLWSDQLARRSGAPADPRIVPFRGVYLSLKKTPEPVVRGMVYPVPDPELPFLGVHVTKHIDGHVILGPTAMVVPSRDSYRLSRIVLRDVWDTITWPGTYAVAAKFWRIGLREIQLATSKRAFVEACAEYVPSLTLTDLDGTSRSGVRAQALGADGRLLDDFVISQDGPVSHVRNAPSPAATSAFALARELVDRALAATVNP